MKSSYTALLLCVLSGCVDPDTRGDAQASESNPDYDQLVTLMTVGPEEDRVLVARTLAQMKAPSVVEALIRATRDERVYLPKGSGINAPFPGMGRLVGDEAEMILGKRFGFETRGSYFQQFGSWERWWETHKGLTDDTIRAEVKEWEGKHNSEAAD